MSSKWKFLKIEIFRKKKNYNPITSTKKNLVIFLKNLDTWGAQGQMTQFNFIVFLPRDLLEFCFFLIVGYTAGSIGLI